MSNNKESDTSSLQKKEHYLEVINKFAIALLNSKSIQDIVWAVAKNAIAQLGYQDCVVYLIDDDHEYLIQRAAHGPKNPVDLDILNPIKIKIGEGIVGHVALSQKGEIVSDTRKDKRYILDDNMRLSEIAVPIIYDNITIGVIDSEHPDINFYPQEDLDILITIASMTATKIMQARFDEKLQEYQSNLQTLVQLKTLELNKALNKLKTQKQELTDSIKYAKRIQKAILTSPNSMKELLPDSFIFYQPKDIIAGDFYVAEKINGKIILAVADCTGHGVPGAIISVVCHNAMKRAIRRTGLSDAANILNETRFLIQESFQGSQEEINDGMDIALCILDTDTLELNYSGAHINLHYFKDEALQIVKADKQPVGNHIYQKPYTNHKIQLTKNDSIYLFTDGYSDQFGGPKGKKFKHKQLRELLHTFKDRSSIDQHELLSETFRKWKGNLSQIDDVCVMGIKL